jgi:hypothetical protein
MDVVDPIARGRVEEKGDRTTYVVVSTLECARCRSGTAAPALSPARRNEFMHNLPSTVQRLILAFTTGLFLACAAHVSAQGDTIPLSSIEQ